MQNRDGGWAAFEKNSDNTILQNLPIESAEDALVDPSSADLTGRTLEFFGTFAGMKWKHPSIQAAVDWLLANQEKNGSWYGKWGVCYIYGTWAAVTGMRAVGIPASHPAIQKAVNWLKEIQHSTGGWGESCKSPEIKQYVPLSFSTPSQTAWAVDAIISVYDEEDEAIERGIQFLLIAKSLSEDMLTYPTGTGRPGQFYINYHSYNYIFPLLTLTHYRNKFHKLT